MRVPITAMRGNTVEAAVRMAAARARCMPGSRRAIREKMERHHGRGHAPADYGASSTPARGPATLIAT
jgi:hypothetical protein